MLCPFSRVTQHALPTCRRIHWLPVGTPPIAPLHLLGVRRAGSDAAPSTRAAKLRARSQRAKPESLNAPASSSSQSPEGAFEALTRDRSQSSSKGVRIQASVQDQVSQHVKKLQSRKTAKDGFPAWKDWKKQPGHQVPYRFRMEKPPKRDRETGVFDPTPEKAYTDYTGLRFPTLETAENYDYYQDRGIQATVERSFPIKVPGYRRLDPYLREYIHFLHSLDPARFTTAKIGERYRLREKTVRKVVSEWGRNRYLTRSGLTTLEGRQKTREDVILDSKERMYSKWVGWDQMGDQDDPDTDDEALGEFKGWRATQDWVRKQGVEVEMMSAFPMMEKRDPMPKRVDVDMVVDNTRRHKIINWIDPNDKVLF